jgi:hypothetical protein
VPPWLRFAPWWIFDGFSHRCWFRSDAHIFGWGNAPRWFPLPPDDRRLGWVELLRRPGGGSLSDQRIVLSIPFSGLQNFSRYRICWRSCASELPVVAVTPPFRHHSAGHVTLTLFTINSVRVESLKLRSPARTHGIGQATAPRRLHASCLAATQKLSPHRKVTLCPFEQLLQVSQPGSTCPMDQKPRQTLDQKSWRVRFDPESAPDVSGCG